MPTLRVTMKQRLFNEEVRNTFHLAGGDASHTNAQSIIDYFRSMWATHIQTQLSINWQLYGASAKELDIVTNPTIEYNLTAGTLAGTNTNDQLPNTVANLVSWIALTARPNRGRTYLAGFCENQIGSSGQFTTGLLTNVGLWAAGMLAVNTLHTGLAMTITRIDKATGVLVGSNTIDSARTNAIPATMRSRRIGQGI